MQYDERQPGFHIGGMVQIPDGRAALVRFVYPAERGVNLIVRCEDNQMLVVPAEKCRLRESAQRGSSGGI